MTDIDTQLAADAIRALLMFMGGIAIAVMVPVLRYHAETLHWVRRGRLRFDDIGKPLFLRSLAHVTAVVFIIAELGSRLGSDITWRTPAAFVVFALTISALVETHKRDKEARTAVRRDET